MAVLGTLVVTATLTCQRCQSTLPLSWPITVSVGVREFAPVDRLSGSERVLLQLFSAAHLGPFTASVEA
jgi:hypothetical protein